MEILRVDCSQLRTCQDSGETLMRIQISALADLIPEPINIFSHASLTPLYTQTQYSNHLHRGIKLTGC